MVKTNPHRAWLIGILTLVGLVLLVNLFGGVGVVLAIIVGVAVLLWLLPPEITGWNRQ